MTVQHRDKVLPLQPFFSDGYRDHVPYVDAVADAVHGYALRDASVFELGDQSRLEELSSPPSLLAFLSMLAGISGARSMLEVGSFVGATALQMAALGLKVTTIEVSAEFSTAAAQNVARNGASSSIQVIHSEAAHALTTFYRVFDLIFIDGAKENYVGLANLAEPLLSSRGLIVIDDVFFHGDALNDEPATAKGRGCRDLIAHYCERSDINSILLPIGNGILVIWK